jgi:(1->4)-alpha-D-glucan 1-alpha-D-glucosylmutase
VNWAVPDRQLPASSYRLQLTSDFGFDAAADLADYLASLGVTHVYLSPILQAVPGSRHGYDVIDHSQVSADLGGEEGFRAMVRRFRARELGVIVDIVPNHMAVPAPESRNRQLWSVLADGTGSPYAHWFDIDWAALDGKFLLPILAGPVDDCLTDLSVADGPVLRYYDHLLPLRPGTEGLPMRELLAAQHYQLAYWRDAGTLLNWRRFFDITSLIGVRVEDPDVFAATHEVVLRLFAEGLIDGLRVDHPDGLADPRGYFRRLAEAMGGAWVVAEKILARDEELPADWECAGTTGYDALALVDGLFVDPDGAAPLTEAYAAFSGGAKTTFAAVAEAAKREVAESMFGAELRRLTRLLPDADAGNVHQVLVELLAAFAVYRAYVHPGEPPSDAASQAIKAAADSARRHLPERLHATLDAVTAAALGAGSAEFAVRFQQTTGPVLAKGVEDTACYRWPRLVSLNEVGADPDRFGVSPAEFHAAARHLATQWPATLTTLSTHDTKRQEDVRARLAALAEHPGEWEREVAAWHEAAGGGIDPETEYLLWQTLVGAWPISGDRLAEYLTKATREAKTRTSWLDPHGKYESAVLDLARRAPVDQIATFVDMIAPDTRVNSLGAKLVQLTMSGVADVYQGCELTGYSLVDPDNRRAVDYDRRRALLAGLDDAPRTDLDTEKLLVTARALHCRRHNPAWFGNDYHPLTAHGPASDHVVAFARGGAVTVATRLPAGLRRRGGWQDTALQLTHGGWHDVLTGATYTGDRLPLSELTRHLPVALLVAQRDRQ